MLPARDKEFTGKKQFDINYLCICSDKMIHSQKYKKLTLCSRQHMNNKYKILIIVSLIVASCVAFGRIAGNDFVSYDDGVYLTENSHIQSGISLENMKWALTAVVCANWHPVTLMSHMMDWSLFGPNAAGHHLVNLLFHIGSVIFLFLFLYKTTNNLWPSAFAAAVFALHPLRVESVAWAAERKDVLSMFFGMASIYAYAFYAEKHKVSFYALCLILFILALMSKPMMVTLPFVLMLLDYWPLQRWQKEKTARIIGEKVPFFLLTVMACFLTIWAQSKGNAFAKSIPLHVVVANVILSYFTYLKKMFWPADLAVHYPYLHYFSLWSILVSILVLIAITVFVIRHIRTMPFLFVGWFWYLGTLVPVIGLVQVGEQAMADRYTYLPSIGIAVGLIWGISFLTVGKTRHRNILSSAAVMCLIIFSTLTWQQCGYWKDNAVLFRHALSVTENNALAYSNLGVVLFQEHKMEDALIYFSKAVSIEPYHSGYYNNRALVYQELGQYQNAVKDYSEAIRLKPDYADAYYNRGVAYGKFGQYQLEIEDYQQAVRLNAASLKAYNNMGIAYGKLKKYQLAIESFNRVIRLDPDYYKAYYNRGFAFSKLGQYENAVADYTEAIRLKPDYARAYEERSRIYILQGKKGGCREVRKSCELENCGIGEIAGKNWMCP